MIREIDTHPNSARWTTINAIIITAAAIWSTWGALNPFQGDTANSRMATVYALIQYGSWEIANPDEPNPFQSGTIDKVTVGTKMYSSKPPIMPIIMTAETKILTQITSLNLDEPADQTTILKIITITLITFPFIMSGIVLLDILRRLNIRPPTQTLALTAFLFGTEYAGYAATINNHVPATACLTIALWGYHTLDKNDGLQTNILTFCLGIIMGLAITIDLPSAIFVLILLLAYLTKFSNYNNFYCFIGLLLPLALHGTIMYILTDSPMPFQLNHDYYLYENSYWRNPIGIDALNHPWPLYLFNMTIGRVGIFILYPILILGTIAILKNTTQKNPQQYWNIAALLAILILGTYYVTSTNNYGGASFGFRWLIITTPFLIIPAAKQIDQFKSKIPKILTLLLLIISIASATQCRLHTWSITKEWPNKIFGPLF